MSQLELTAAEIMENRQRLFDIEILLNQFRADGIYTEDDSFATQVVGQALAGAGIDKLLEVCQWMEQLHDRAEQAEKREAEHSQ